MFGQFLHVTWMPHFQNIHAGGDLAMCISKVFLIPRGHFILKYCMIKQMSVHKHNAQTSGELCFTAIKYSIYFLIAFIIFIYHI